MVTFSMPREVGIVATRRSMRSRPGRMNEILPSCAMRRSEMSRFDMILMRETTAR